MDVEVESDVVNSFKNRCGISRRGLAARWAILQREMVNGGWIYRQSGTRDE